MQRVPQTEVSRKRSRHDDVVTPHPVIKIEPPNIQWNARTPAPRSRGQVMCGHCRVRRASVCCMEEPCVLFAERKWRMTTMLICPECDNAIHNNPVMSDHCRSPLSIRGLTVLELEDSSHNGDVTSGCSRSALMIEHTQDFDAASNPNGTPPPGSDGTASPAFPSGLVEEMSCCDAAGGGVDSPQTCSRQSISLANLKHVHKRYAIVMEHHLSHRCSLVDTFKQTNVPRQTLMDTLALAELQIIDPGRFDEFTDAVRRRSVSSRVADMERSCRAIIRDSYKARMQSLRGTTLLPIHVNVYE